MPGKQGEKKDEKSGRTDNGTGTGSISGSGYGR